MGGATDWRLRTKLSSASLALLLLSTIDLMPDAIASKMPRYIQGEPSRTERRERSKVASTGIAIRSFVIRHRAAVATLLGHREEYNTDPPVW